jgi:hypothetical protein
LGNDIGAGREFSSDKQLPHHSCWKERLVKVNLAFAPRCCAIAAYYVLICSISVAIAQAAVTTDVVGGTANAVSASGLAKGNVYRLDTSVDLIQFESYLSFSGTETLNFYVYKNSAEFGTYTQVASTTYSATGTGSGAFYSSGPLNLGLSAGQWYLLAASWSGASNTYYFDSGATQTTSFGAYTHGYASGTHPLAGTVSTTIDDQAIYYQRLTTAVPEPTSLFLAACGFAGLADRGRRQRKHW